MDVLLMENSLRATSQRPCARGSWLLGVVAGSKHHALIGGVRGGAWFCTDIAGKWRRYPLH